MVFTSSVIFPTSFPFVFPPSFLPPFSCSDVGQNPLQFSVHVSDTSVAAKTEVSSSNDIVIHFRLVKEDSVHVVLQ